MSRERVSEVGWVVDYLSDLEADFLALYGIDDMLSLPGPQFLRLAMRTPAFPGVMQARAQALVDAEGAPGATAVQEAPTAHREPQAGVRDRNGVQVVEPTREAIQGSMLAGVIEMGGGR